MSISITKKEYAEVKDFMDNNRIRHVCNSSDTFQCQINNNDIKQIDRSSAFDKSRVLCPFKITKMEDEIIDLVWVGAQKISALFVKIDKYDLYNPYTKVVVRENDVLITRG